jgi:uncharacterized protein YjiK
MAHSMTLRHLLLITLMLSSCNYYNNRNKKYESPKGYNLAEPTRFHVRQSMQEISGIVLAPDEHHILAINDEQGRVFSIDVTTKDPYPNWKFHKSGDYEDLATDGKNWLVLKSNGHLYHVTGLFSDSTAATTYKLPMDGKKEFETLYYDARNDGMVMVCKECADDKGKGYNTAYRFDMGTWTFDENPFYRINIADIERLSGEDINLFKPSGAAVHPIEKRLYMLSAVNRMLVITDMDGKVQEAYNLKHSTFGQPEGISFAANGDMYISNESADESSANILKFKYNQRPQ